MLVIPLLIVAVGLFFWLTGGKTASTDNAYVKQDIVAVSTQINGPVIEVFVDENQHVTRGQPLFRVDPAPSQVALFASPGAACRSRTPDPPARRCCPGHAR